MHQERFLERSEYDAAIDDCHYLIARNARFVRERVFRENQAGDTTITSEVLASYASYAYERLQDGIQEGDESLDALMLVNTNPKTLVRAAYAGISAGSQKARHILERTLDFESSTVYNDPDNCQRAPAQKVSPVLWHTALQAKEYGHSVRALVNRFAVSPLQVWDIDIFDQKNQEPAKRDQTIIEEHAKELLNAQQHSAVSVFNRARFVLPLLEEDSELRREIAVRFFHSWRHMDFSNRTLEIFIGTSQHILSRQSPVDNDLYEHIQDNISSVTDLLEMEGADPFELEAILLPWKVTEAHYLGNPTDEIIETIDTSTMGLLSRDIPDESRGNMEHNRSEVMDQRNNMLAELARQTATNRAFHDAKRYIKAISGYPAQEQAFLQAYTCVKNSTELRCLAPDDINAVLSPHLISLYNLHQARVSNNLHDVHKYAQEIIDGCVTSDAWDQRTYLSEAFNAAHSADKTLGLAIGRQILAAKRKNGLAVDGLSNISKALIKDHDPAEMKSAIADIRSAKSGASRAVQAFHLLRILESDS